MASPGTIFRAAIILEWVLIGLAVAVSLSTSLPKELEAFTVERQDWHPVLDTLSGVALIVSVVASVGLWFFRNWARPTYALASIWLVLAVAFGEPVVTPAVAGALEELSLIVTGFIVGLSYFSQIGFGAQQGAPAAAPSARG